MPTIARPPNAVEFLPDNGYYRCRFTVRSDTSDQVYTVSFNSSPGLGRDGYWCCSCRGCITHGHCKHLRACGLQGRDFRNQPTPSWSDFAPVVTRLDKEKAMFRDWAIRSMVQA